MESSNFHKMSSKLEGPNSSGRTTKLMDSGNLVLFQDDDNNNNNNGYMWQSFYYPTDTFLPGMKMDADLKLASWSSDKDPKRGSYIFMMDPTEEAPYIILKNYQRYWERERGNHLISASFFHSVVYLLNNFSSNGELQFLDWNDSKSDWMVRWKAPHSFCDVQTIRWNRVF
ncbi:hypothetical protein PIB30_013992 [Stylosanthes scabra]|uniref:Bulb-type lectin domain-containing protein n=1 Tax=Stylosanthes scabra TaxID=79078 RepID=A0ABU6Y565_9FABA|nr:hypothetical protein [Stylosanthes scabra]